MTHQRWTWLRYAVSVVGIMLAACAVSPPAMLAPASMTPLPEVPTPTATTTAVPSQVPVTHAPASMTPVLSATPPPIPTLTTEQAGQFAAAMLANNGGCELPCWWGVAPGTTADQTVKDLFASHGLELRSGKPHYEGGERLFGVSDPERTLDPERPLDYYINVRFDTRDGVVRSIRVDSETYNAQLSDRFTQDWRPYAWSSILARYGPPSWVGIWLQPFPEPDAPNQPEEPTVYSLELIYEPLGFAINYRGPAVYIKKANIVRACPVFDQVTAISIRSVSPENSVVQLILSEREMSSLGPSLEETTGMSVKTFYETFKTTSTKACLEGLSETSP